MSRTSPEKAEIVSYSELAQLYRTIWRGRRIVAICAAVGVLLAVVYLHTAPYKYTATLSVTSANSSQQISSRIGSLATLAGVDTSLDEDQNNFELFLAGLTSREAAKAIAERPDMMRELFPGQWDEVKQQWKKPPRFLGGLRDSVKWTLGFPVRHWSPPGAPEVQDFLTNTVVITRVRGAPVVEVTLDHRDPAFAVHLLTVLADQVDNYLRHRAIIKLDAYTRYVSAKLATVTLAEHRQALAALLSDQEKKRMIASFNRDYAAERFGQVIHSTVPVNPRPITVLAGGFLGGMVIGLASVIIRRRVASLVQ